MEKMKSWPNDFINKIICGDCLEVMGKIPGDSIDMCMTSPPYWGLRDYGNEQVFDGDKDCEHEWISERLKFNKQGAEGKQSTNLGTLRGNDKDCQWCQKCNAWKGQLGLEPTPELYIEHMTAIFHEVKRVLKKEGTLWLNIGDTYWGGKGKSGYELPHKAEERRGAGKTIQHSYNVPGYMDMRPSDGKHNIISSKCLCMIPERLAWSLIQDGWILRNKIVWYKPNAMPSSVKDRFSNKWEYIFLFSQSKKYYFDLDSVRESYTESTHERYKYPINKLPRGWAEDGVMPMSGGKTPMGAIIGDSGAAKVPGGKGWTGHPPGGEHALRKDPRWCPPDGKNPGDFWSIHTQPFPEAHFAVFPERLCEKPIKAGCPEGGIVLDPFCGAGTTLYVAKQLRRRFIGIDVKAEYCKMSEKRLAQGVL